MFLDSFYNLLCGPGWQASEPWLSVWLSLPSLELQTRAPCPFFGIFCGFYRSNSGSWTCVASTALSEQSLQPLRDNFLSDNLNSQMYALWVKWTNKQSIRNLNWWGVNTPKSSSSKPLDVLTQRMIFVFILQLRTATWNQTFWIPSRTPWKRSLVSCLTLPYRDDPVFQALDQSVTARVTRLASKSCACEPWRGPS